MPAVPWRGHAVQAPTERPPKAWPCVSATQVAPRPTSAATPSANNVPSSSLKVGLSQGAASSVGLPLPGGERVGVRGFEPLERPYPLTPPLSQSKSDVSDFDRTFRGRTRVNP